MPDNIIDNTHDTGVDVFNAFVLEQNTPKEEPVEILQTEEKPVTYLEEYISIYKDIVSEVYIKVSRPANSVWMRPIQVCIKIMRPLNKEFKLLSVEKFKTNMTMTLLNRLSKNGIKKNTSFSFIYYKFGTSPRRKNPHVLTTFYINLNKPGYVIDLIYKDKIHDIKKIFEKSLKESISEMKKGLSNQGKQG